MKCSIKMRYLLSYHLYKTLKNPTFVKKGTFFIFFKLGFSPLILDIFQTESVWFWERERERGAFFQWPVWLKFRGPHPIQVTEELPSPSLSLKKCPTNNQTGSNWKVDCSYWKETPPRKYEVSNFFLLRDNPDEVHNEKVGTPSQVYIGF